MIFKKRATKSQLIIQKVVPWIIFGFIVTLSALVLVTFFLRTGSGQSKMNENLESFYLMQRFLKSCFVYDRNGILLSKVIDTDKFNEERLNSCYKINENLFPALRVTLTSDTAKINKIIKTSNWNGNRPAEEIKNPDNVLIYSQDKLYNGEVLIEIQNPR